MRFEGVVVLVCVLCILEGLAQAQVGSLISRDTFNDLLRHRNDAICPARGFYTYDAFVAAAGTFPAFGTTGDTDTRKREIAAFLGQTSHETTGGTMGTPGADTWGYCFKEEINPRGDYCDRRSQQQWPCVPGKSYHGRGPIQLTGNYNYGPAGRALEVNLLNDPDAVANNAVLSFRTAFWFWMTTQNPKPSPHDVITGRWTPSLADQAARRVQGYGLITNIINGGFECGKGPIREMQDRIGYYIRYCNILRVSPGPNLDCNNQSPYPA